MRGNSIFNPQTWLPGRSRPVASHRRLPIYLLLDGSIFSFTEDGFERYLTDLIREIETAGFRAPSIHRYGHELKKPPRKVYRERDKDGYSNYCSASNECRFFHFDDDTELEDYRNHLKYFRQMKETHDYPRDADLEMVERRRYM